VGDEQWRQLANRQSGMLARRQLRGLGIDADRVRNQIAAGRWAERSDSVVSVTTGALTHRQRLWLGALHAGGDALVGGRSAAAAFGLQHWDRDDVAVLIDDRLTFDPVPGIQFVKTRRSLTALRDPRADLPLCRIEPAVLLFAGYERSSRTAQGVLAAVVQQRLTTVARLSEWLDRLRPLRRAATFRTVLADIAGGAQSLGEIDIGRICTRFGLSRPRRQRPRRDRHGRIRFTDCEWEVADGRVVVLEIDGSFHMDVEHWEQDLARHRALSGPRHTVVRCTTRELRDRPERVVADLRALGIP
jgi:hypothetical protein